MNALFVGACGLLLLFCLVMGFRDAWRAYVKYRDQRREER